MTERKTKNKAAGKIKPSEQSGGFVVSEREKEKHPGGRPPKYESPEELQTKIDEYFESCWIDKVTENTDKDGNCTMSTVRYQNEPYTLAGLAWFLGFVSRQSLWDYAQKNEEFSYVIKRARLKIESHVEGSALVNKNAAGPIFWLKNHAGYEDKQEVKHGGDPSNPISITVNFVKPKPNEG